MGVFNWRGNYRCVAPFAETARWDDKGYDFPWSDEIGLLDDEPVGGRHGFPFHAACWSILEMVFHPRRVPCDRLLEFCQSFLFELDTIPVGWGHDFGGLFGNGGEEVAMYEYAGYRAQFVPSVVEVATHDPYRVSEISQLLPEASENPPNGLKCLGVQITSRDVFFKLPGELRGMIATLLPTSDFLRLRQASRAFAPLFACQSFWASRFMPTGERGWLFEVWNERKPRDWLALYRRTNDARLSPALRNRKRVWKLSQYVKDTLVMASKGHIEPVLSQFTSSDVSRGSIARNSPSDELHANTLPADCLGSSPCRVRVPAHLCQIIFCTIRFGGLEYVTGLRMVSQDGQRTSLGYWNEERTFTHDVSRLRGFELAAGPKGIHAVRILMDATRSGPWIGCPDKAPNFRSLATPGTVSALEADLDVRALWEP